MNLTTVKEGNFSILFFYNIDSKHPLKYTMTWFKFSVGTFYIFVEWVSSESAKHVLISSPCTSSICKIIFYFPSLILPNDAEHSILYMEVIGYGSVVTVVPEVPGTYRAQHCSHNAVTGSTNNNSTKREKKNLPGSWVYLEQLAILYWTRCSSRSVSRHPRQNLSKMLGMFRILTDFCVGDDWPIVTNIWSNIVLPYTYTI